MRCPSEFRLFHSQRSQSRRLSHQLLWEEEWRGQAMVIILNCNRTIDSLEIMTNGLPSLSGFVQLYYLPPAQLWDSSLPQPSRSVSVSEDQVTKVRTTTATTTAASCYTLGPSRFMFGNNLDVWVGFGLVMADFISCSHSHLWLLENNKLERVIIVRVNP